MSDPADRDEELSATLHTDQLNSLEELGTLSINEILDQDSRPTFIIDLDPDEGVTGASRRILPIFCNAALRSHHRLCDAVLGNEPAEKANETIPSRPQPSSATYEAFSLWATGVTKFDDSKDVFPLTFLFRDMLWTGSTVRKRWRLVSGTLWSAALPGRHLSSGPPSEVGSCRAGLAERPKPVGMHRRNSLAPTEGSSTLASANQHPPIFPRTPRTGNESSTDTSASSTHKRLLLASPEKAVADWTVPNPTGALTPHLNFVSSFNWAATPLGAMQTWSREFRQVVNLVMNNPHPASLFWGPDLTTIYNEAYGNEVAGNKHPLLMGTAFSGPFAELWDGVVPIFAECARAGISVRRDNDYLPIHRFGILEETFFSWSWVPLYGGTDRILGFYNAPFETTQFVLAQRRTQIIREVGDHVSRAKSIKQFWDYLLEALDDNHFDVPFALLYSVGDGDDEQASISSGSTLSLKSCFLEGSIGLPDGHLATPKQLDLKRSREGFIPAFREAMRTREPTLLHTTDGSLPEELLDGIEWRGFGDACKEAIIFPVRPTNGEAVLAFLLIGVNPRRPYDDDYKTFTTALNRQLATLLASFMLYEEEVKRNRDAAEAAALQQEDLSQQLAMQTNRFRRMTELSPLGMFLSTPEGVLREANDRYYEMTNQPRDDGYEMSWTESIEEGSRKAMMEGWHRLTVDHVAWNGELEMIRTPGSDLVDLNGEPIKYWVMCTAAPEFNPDGSLRSVMGSITDISHLKWAQGLQDRRLREAEERRRQQNEFIDITSHEMRNPLSAVLQCAEDILTTLESHRDVDKPPSPTEILNMLDAANTISLCVQHQKAIVDDILTISKLDSKLLVITPIPAQPIQVVKRAVKMFEAELQAKDIQMVFDVHPSFEELNIDWMAFDPSRVLQILINLLTNAIKFTASSRRRFICVEIGVSRDPPVRTDTPGFQYVPAKMSREPKSAVEDWGTGEPLYTWFKVEDTGCGLTPEEMKVLFSRFSQASPRTHAQYGGSGLGLFISRQLAELHGGQIGVASRAGQGSVFSFFVRTRNTEPPEPGTSLPSGPLTERALVSKAKTHDAMSPKRHDRAVPDPPQGLGPYQTTPTPADEFDPKKLDILVVEDNLVNQMVLVKQLKKVGSSVSVANDGVECLQHLETTDFITPAAAGGKQLSVILMDLEMPNMDGLTCVREIRKMEAEGRILGGKKVPVIAVTANVRDEQVRTAMRAGMDDVVSKPFRIPALMKKIQELLAVIDPRSEPASPAPR